MWLLGIALCAFLGRSVAALSNPYSTGCLATLAPSMFPPERYRRVCNSDDLGNTSTCREDPFDNSEIRLSNADWESATVQTWIAQILLSEVLGMPASVETGSAGASMGFYDPQGGLGFGVGYDFNALRLAGRSDPLCTTRTCVGRGPCSTGAEEYVSCSHFFPEVWAGAAGTFEVGEAEGTLRHAGHSGLVGQMGLFVSSHAITRNPALATHIGYANEAEMRNTFKRPLRWREYCDPQISPHAGCCLGGNLTAAQEAGFAFPANATECRTQSLPPSVEAGSTFHTVARSVQLLDETKPGKMRGYSGFFTPMSPGQGGFYVQAPCEWSTFADSQIHWNSMQLSSLGGVPQAGYSYSDMARIFEASAVQEPPEPIVTWWWTPDATMTKWLENGVNRAYQLTKIQLPTYTRECGRLRPASGSPTDDDPAAGKCSADPAVRRGSRLGDYNAGCEQPAESMFKVVAASLAHTNPVADTVLHSLQISTEDMLDILRAWSYNSIPSSAGEAPRRAVCQWMVQNTDKWLKFTPKGYPLAFVEAHGGLSTLSRSVLVSMAGVGIVLTAACLLFVVANRHEPVVRRGHFVSLVTSLIGCFMLYSTGIVFTRPVSNGLCILAPLLGNVAFALVLAPLLVKTYAISLIMRNNRLQRITITPLRMTLATAAWVALLLMYIGLWYAVGSLPHMEASDHPSELVGSENEQQFVERVYQCRYSLPWFAGLVTMQYMFLLWGVFLAIQTRGIPSKFNESSYIGFTIYNAFVTNVFILAAAVTSTDRTSPAMVAGALAGGVWWIASGFVACLIVPKVYLTLTHQQEAKAAQPRPGVVEFAQSPVGRKSLRHHVMAGVGSRLKSGRDLVGTLGRRLASSQRSSEEINTKQMSFRTNTDDDPLPTRSNPLYSRRGEHGKNLPAPPDMAMKE